MKKILLCGTSLTIAFSWVDLNWTENKNQNKYAWADLLGSALPPTLPTQAKNSLKSQQTETYDFKIHLVEEKDNKATNKINGPDNKVVGLDNSIVGGKNEVNGNINHLTGFLNKVEGAGNEIAGDKNFVKGSDNFVSGKSNVVSGQDNKISSTGSKVTGSGNVVIGQTESELLKSLYGNDNDNSVQIIATKKIQTPSLRSAHYNPPNEVVARKFLFSSGQ